MSHCSNIALEEYNDSSTSAIWNTLTAFIFNKNVNLVGYQSYTSGILIEHWQYLMYIGKKMQHMFSCVKTYRNLSLWPI